jgi:L-aminopeptidase/D-esterase-like protein
MVVSMTAVGPVGAGAGATCGEALGASGSGAGVGAAAGVWAAANVALKRREAVRSRMVTVLKVLRGIRLSQSRLSAKRGFILDAGRGLCGWEVAS